MKFWGGIRIFDVFKLFFHHNKKSCVQLVSKLAFFRTRRHCRTRCARATILTTSAEKSFISTLVAQIAIPALRAFSPFSALFHYSTEKLPFPLLFSVLECSIFRYRITQ